MPLELNDVRVLIPQTRRALDGPTATSSASVSSTLDDEQVKGLIADAIAEIIFFTGGLFGHELTVAERDEVYNAPTEWTVDPPLEPHEAVVITSQAALTYFFHYLRDMKVQETIRDEGQEWSYTLSTSVLRDYLKYLAALRDKALEQVQEPMPVAFINLLHERDAAVAMAIEPYFYGELTG